MGLREETKGIYKTARGAEIGQLKSDIKELYGATYAIDKAERNIDYYYDSKKKKFIGEISLGGINQTEAKEDIYMASIGFNTEGTAEIIMLLDYKWATLLS
ncbi:hypothetical protein [Cohnella silvisoli]|uniref:Uncharacterized protein n=1 Tax=Cohnella silvisoli TaxID=2873699 RepID=A0ABV1KN23_9BACL|nr:hypothetical protein [Cohnella silvisoli]MCD9020189.1 hypothetical protein [Cohnella silvisoli]